MNPSIASIVANQRRLFSSDQTKPYTYRKQQLLALKKAIEKHQQEILDALMKDLHKGEFEAYTTEVGFNLRSIRDTLKHLRQWMKPRRVKGEVFLPFTTSKVMPEPKGVVLIIGPFNYPFQLVMEPLIGAIAAGNTAIIKPSEYTPHVAKVIETLISETFSSDYIYVLNGDADVTIEALKERFDHLFFTGSTRVGQRVYEAASRHLTPVTLELGGKSPTIVDATANIKVASERIAFAKFTNAGQTCIAPDYVYVHTSVKDALIKELKKVIEKRYSNPNTFGHIVSSRHYARLTGYLGKREENPSSLYLKPILVEDATWDDEVMKEEIFGPILPIMTFESIDEVITMLKTKEKPLALYLFSEDRQVQRRVWTSLSFGNGAINDALMQVASSHLPFGGVGQSGFGSYHGKASFDTFSHHKSYIKKATFIDLPVAYPPYTSKQLKIIKKLIK